MNTALHIYPFLPFPGGTFQFAPRLMAPVGSICVAAVVLTCTAHNFFIANLQLARRQRRDKKKLKTRSTYQLTGTDVQIYLYRFAYRHFFLNYFFVSFATKY